MMGTAMVLLVLLVICIFAVRSYMKKLSHGGGCCGEHEAMEKKVKVGDRDKSHYPYTVVLKIDGMTCGNCTRRVENALNRMDGTWAEVDLGEQRATVRTKQPANLEQLRQVVQEAGYLVLSAK
jgi:copper chaperone CopZ